MKEQEYINAADLEKVRSAKESLKKHLKKGVTLAFADGKNDEPRTEQ